MPRVLASALALAVVALLVGGCPDDTAAGGPVDTCTKAGEQCRIQGGQLGVCTMNTDGELTCAPQH